MAGPVPRAGPVPEEAVRDLVAALPDRDRLSPDPIDLLDLPTAAREARRFKLDASFPVEGPPHARFSVNDKGEPAAFRLRVRAALGPAADSFDRFFALSPPGEVQATAGLKWAPGGGLPARVSLYFEDLHKCPRAPEILDAAFDLVTGRPAPPGPAGLLPAAVCLELDSGGSIAGLKDYHLGIETEGSIPLPLSPAARPFFDRFPFDPARGTRRVALGRRFDRQGGETGRKLVWVTEVHDAASADRAWAAAGPVPRAVDSLRRSWRHGPGTLLYPDLVTADLAPDLTSRGLLMYVSLK